MCTARAMRRHNHWQYPTGTTRYEPLATLIIAAGGLLRGKGPGLARLTHGVW